MAQAIMWGDRSRLQKLYNHPSHSDITLKFGDEKIYAHKAILMACSTFFFTAFDVDFKEKEEGVFAMREHDSQTIHAMIKHIYGFPLRDLLRTDVLMTEDDFQSLIDIFLIANDYQIESLGMAISGIVSEILKFCYDGYIAHPTQKTTLRMIISKTAELYNTLKLTDQSLLKAVLQFCTLDCDFVVLERNFGVSKKSLALFTLSSYDGTDARRTD